jgi:predicted metalloprotease with PDZ domain
MKPTNNFRMGTAAVLVLCLASFISDASAASRRPGYLGVSIGKLTVDDKKELKADFGALVTGVSEDGPAEKAGLREDDVIQSFDQAKIRRPQDLTRKVRETKPGTKVKIGFVRDGKSMEVEAEVARLRTPRMQIGGAGDRGFRISGSGGARLGLRLQELNGDLAEYFKVGEDEGALVTEVEEDGPAGEAGIKAGDVIVKIDGDEVTEPGDVADILSDRDEGDTVEITLIRKGVRQTATVEVEEKNFNFRFNMPEMNINVPDIDIEVPDVPDVPHMNIQVDLDEKCMDELKRDMEELKIELKNELKDLEELKDLDLRIEVTRI